MLTSEFDFVLPPDRIAQHPADPRDSARLMVIDRALGSTRSCVFRDLSALLRPGDVLVRNNSRVIPARLIGRRLATGGAWEGLYLRTTVEGAWEILAKTRGRPRPGETFETSSGLRLTLINRIATGAWQVAVSELGDPFAILERHGRIPLPPYIRKGIDSPEDRARYQTAYAVHPGSVAAPTAGLHFTQELLAELSERGVTLADITLHVGIGTFRPIEADSIEQHQVHPEWAELSDAVADTLNSARAKGGRVIAVGTTSTRTLEAAVDALGRFHPFHAATSLYLKPGHTFRAVDGLITNFHLPRSSLLVLVTAFAGYQTTLNAYHRAIAEGYRFYSYGDAMLIL